MMRNKKEAYMRHKLYYVAIILLLLGNAGCAKKMVINIDGMPISNHEYAVFNSENEIRLNFVLVRYFKEMEEKEYLIKPEYLDALHANRIDTKGLEALTLHLKVVNLKKQFYTVNWSLRGPGSYRLIGFLYSGKLSRKDFYVQLPYFAAGEYSFNLTVANEKGNDLFSLPEFKYIIKEVIGKSKASY
jgi:hypothetical protein